VNWGLSHERMIRPNKSVRFHPIGGSRDLRAAGLSASAQCATESARDMRCAERLDEGQTASTMTAITSTPTGPGCASTTRIPIRGSPRPRAAGCDARDKRRCVTGIGARPVPEQPTMIVADRRGDLAGPTKPCTDRGDSRERTRIAVRFGGNRAVDRRRVPPRHG